MRMRRLARWLIVLLPCVATVGTAAAEAPLLDAVKRGDTKAVRTLLQQRADAGAADPDGTSALHWAARQDDLVSADLLLRAGASARAVNVFGVSPLWLALINGSVPMIDRLLKAGADPNSAIGEGETALMTASRTGNVEAVKLLLAHGAAVNPKVGTGQTAVMFAAAEGHTAVLRALIEAGADVGARTNAERVPPPPPPAAPNAVRAKRVVTGSTPSRRSTNGGFTPLLFAVREGHIDAARILLEAGANANDALPDGTSAVTLAATNAHYELALFLVSKGADPNAAANGWTALHAVTWVRRPNLGFNAPGPVQTGNIDSLTFVREMVKLGANPNLRATQQPRNVYRVFLNRIGSTPLMIAALLADAPLMRVLIEMGADGTIANEDNTTVLMAASGVGVSSPGEEPGTEEEAFECVKLALALGGDVNAVDAYGDTALHGAAYRAAGSIVRLLVDHGANTFMQKNDQGWTPLRVASGIFRTMAYRDSPPTAALLRQLMTERGLPTNLEDTPGSAAK
jgi:ankyrin repeat protein